MAMPQQPGGGGGGTYQIMTVDAGCCSGSVPPERIQSTANDMANRGYRLQQMYIDIRSMCGPFMPIKTAVMIFRRQDVPF